MRTRICRHVSVLVQVGQEQENVRDDVRACLCEVSVSFLWYPPELCGLRACFLTCTSYASVTMREEE
jgi:hypothetical protein